MPRDAKGRRKRLAKNQTDTLLSFRSGEVHCGDRKLMVQNQARTAGKKANGQGKGGGPKTAAGKERQIISRLTHGIRSRSPVLLHVESEAEWWQHLEGIRQSYAPVGEAEECLVYLIAYQYWRWIARLLPYERDLSFTKMTTPSDDLLGEGCSKADIHKVLSTPSKELGVQQKAARDQLARYEALGKGDDSTLVFSASEVEELVGWFQKRVCVDGGLELEDESEDRDDDDPGDEGPIFDGENRSWSAPEVQEQLRILCEAAGADWREKLYWILCERQRDLEKDFSHLDEAREQIAYNRILGLEELNRLTLYERQILATLKHLVNQLERHQARRLGQPVAAPVAFDVTVAHHGAQPEIP
jgi:hypothetical protein